MLENNRSFFRRHIGNSPQEQQKMLDELGYKDIKELISKTVPENIHYKDLIFCIIDKDLKLTDSMGRIWYLDMIDVKLIGGGSGKK